MASKANARQKAGIEAGLKMKTTSVWTHRGLQAHQSTIFCAELA